MSTPVVTVVEPTNAKAWVGLVGAALSAAVPLLVALQTNVPEPWPAVIGAVLAVATSLGVHQTRNAPKDTSIVPNSQIVTLPPTTPYTPVPDVPATDVTVGEGGYGVGGGSLRQRPWRYNQ